MADPYFYFCVEWLSIYIIQWLSAYVEWLSVYIKRLNSISVFGLNDLYIKWLSIYIKRLKTCFCFFG
jgi:hypothetical protein